MCLLPTSNLHSQDMAPNGSDSDHCGQAPAVQQAFPKSLSQNGCEADIDAGEVPVCVSASQPIWDAFQLAMGKFLLPRTSWWLSHFHRFEVVLSCATAQAQPTLPSQKRAPPAPAPKKVHGREGGEIENVRWADGTP